jgi:hypothetical protein
VSTDPGSTHYVGDGCQPAHDPRIDQAHIIPHDCGPVETCDCVNPPRSEPCALCGDQASIYKVRCPECQALSDVCGSCERFAFLGWLQCPAHTLASGKASNV